MVTPESVSADEFPFLKYTECNNQLKSLHEILCCAGLRWSTDDEHEHAKSLQGERRTRSLRVVSEWLGVGPLSRIEGRVDVVRADDEIQSFAEVINWY